MRSGLYAHTEQERRDSVSEEEKKLIDETVENLKHLSKESLLILKSGSEMLKSRDDFEKEDES